MIREINRVYDDTAHFSDYQPISRPSEVIALMFDSVRKHHKNCRCITITDEDTELDLPNSIELFRIPRKSDKLEIEMLTAKIWCLRNLENGGNFIFLDADMLVIGNLEQIFERDASLFFTYHRVLQNKELLCPINVGFIAVKETIKQEVALFFEELLKLFSSFKEEKYHYWMGLQFILKELFCEKLLKSEYTRSIDTLFFYHRWIRIEFLDAAKYNCTLSKNLKTLSEVKVLHFKGGGVKHLMFAYKKKYPSNKQKSEG